MIELMHWVKGFFIHPAPEEILAKYLATAKRDLIETEFQKDYIDHKVIQLRSRIARVSSELKRITEEGNK